MRPIVLLIVIVIVVVAATTAAASATTTTTTTRFLLRPGPGAAAAAAAAAAPASGGDDCSGLKQLQDGSGLWEYFSSGVGMETETEARLRRLGFDVVAKQHGRPLRAAPPAGYTPPEEIFALMQQLAAQYPTRARLVDVSSAYGPGPTYNGNRIYALKIASNVNDDDDDDSKPNVILVSNHHSRELLSTEISVNITARLVTEYSSNPQIKSIVDSYQIYVFWTLNPDGLNYVWDVDDMWRKNRVPNRDGSYGVDLNRNYPIGWDFSCAGSSVPSSDTYRGVAPGSEIEVQTMMAFQEAIRPVKVLDLHNYAREVRIIYGDCASLPALVDNYFKSVAVDVADLMSYVQARSCCMAGNIHFAYHNQGSLTFLIETGNAFQPPESTMRSEIARVTPGILYFFSLPTPVSGRVLDGRTSQPVEAFIDIPSIAFNLGELRPSHPKTGLYHLWLPNGSYNVTVTVPGYRSTSVVLTASNAGVVRDIVV